MSRRYSLEYKKSAVMTYYNSKNGLRVVAKELGLSSKSYLERWDKELKDKGIIPKDLKKNDQKSDSIDYEELEPVNNDIESLRKENEELRARAEVWEKFAGYMEKERDERLKKNKKKHT
jgi:transposase-like protein